MKDGVQRQGDRIVPDAVLADEYARSLVGRHETAQLENDVLKNIYNPEIDKLVSQSALTLIDVMY